MEASAYAVVHIMIVNLGSCDELFLERWLIARRWWLEAGAYKMFAVIPRDVEVGAGNMSLAGMLKYWTEGPTPLPGSENIIERVGTGRAKKPKVKRDVRSCCLLSRIYRPYRFVKSQVSMNGDFSLFLPFSALSTSCLDASETSTVLVCSW